MEYHQIRLSALHSQTEHQKICLGLKSKTVRVERTYQNNMWGRIHKKLYEFFYPPKEIDLSNLYPYI
jgi:hypothetical protein